LHTSGQPVWFCCQRLHLAADKTEDLPLLIADSRYAVFGHIYCLPEDTPPMHIVLNHTVSDFRGAQSIPGWKRPLGRPRKTWLQQVETDQGVDADMSWSHAQDRDMWRLPSLIRHNIE